METVVEEKPLSLATSRIVTIEVFTIFSQGVKPGGLSAGDPLECGLSLEAS